MLQINGSKLACASSRASKTSVLRASNLSPLVIYVKHKIVIVLKKDCQEKGPFKLTWLLHRIVAT